MPSEEQDSFLSRAEREQLTTTMEALADQLHRTITVIRTMQTSAGANRDTVIPLAATPFEVARRHLAQLRARERHLPKEFLSDVAWNILLDLFIEGEADRPVSISSACIASGAPATTALRWIHLLHAKDIIERTADKDDARRVYVSLTEQTRDAIVQWLTKYH